MSDNGKSNGNGKWEGPFSLQELLNMNPANYASSAAEEFAELVDSLLQHEASLYRKRALGQATPDDVAAIHTILAIRVAWTARVKNLSLL